MTELLIRGRVLTFVEAPQGIDDTRILSLRGGRRACWSRDGKIVAIGDYADDAAGAGRRRRRSPITGRT